ncbi:MAG: 4-hydroxy-tetrahydrodipicolinate reductase [Gammaproteobacteria bacterium]|nr:4-hydroxy-tetrahydrodipicolinate reductase [Gammaproteobacteria bacterium]
MTNIAIHGFFGRMGQAIFLEARQMKSLSVTVGIDQEQTISDKTVEGVQLTNTLESLRDEFDVVIDFSLPTPSIINAQKCSDSKVPLVIGTTGFTKQQHEKIKNLSKNIPILLAPNMSLGVNVSLDALAYIAKMLPDYRVTIEETHHVNKVDSPSGTAIKIANVICESRGIDLGDIENKDCPIEFLSHRKDTEIGTHTIYFKGQNDDIVFTHNASNRNIFANGSLRGSRWIVKQKPGLYSFKQFMDSEV